MLISRAAIPQDLQPLGRVGRGVVGLVPALAGGLVLEQLGDLGQREAGVVAQALDEAEPLDVRGVVEAIVTVGPGGGSAAFKLAWSPARTL